MEYSTISAESLKQKQKTRVVVNGRNLLLLWLNDQPHAILDKCPHMGSPLSTGSFQDGILKCKDHLLEIDIAKKQIVDSPKSRFLMIGEFDPSIRSYETFVKDGIVIVKM